jgi:hypothetical protein
MTTFAIIEDGVVTQLLVRDALPPMHPDLAYVEVPDGTQRYQTFDGTNFGPRPTRSAPTVDELRIAAYGPIGDQLDMQYKDALNGTTTWADHIAAVKAANPK